MFNKNLRDDAEQLERTMTEDTSITAGGDPAPTQGQDEVGLSVTAEVEAEALALSGSRSVFFADWLAEQVALCQPLPADEAGRGRCMAATVDALKTLTPQNGMEGMLAGQMVAAHNIALTLTAQAFHRSATKEAELFLRQGLRAMGVYVRQMELMARQRGRRRQSVRIEHEQVDADGRVSVRAEAERVR
jgi:hypothetical protein